MKKRLLVLMAILMPVILLAQPMDTTTIYREDFEGDTIMMTVSHLPNGGGTVGDWRIVGPNHTYEANWHNLPLYKSPVNSYHSPVYSVAGNSQASTGPIPLSSPGLDVRYVYIDFDHICKVNNLDNATLYYQIAEGFDEYGNYNWGQWKMLNFASNSPFYYGDAKSTNNNAFSGGALSDKMYANWLSNSLTAVPDNTWWHHEMIDLTSKIFVEGTNPTHFRFQWRLNKTSPPTSGTDTCAGWYIDNLIVRLSNCELIHPEITMVAPLYFNTTGFNNDVGPYTIKAKLFDNDSIAEELVQFSYEINDGPTVIVSNDGAFTSNTGPTASGHTIQAQWVLPSICYWDTIFYHIYLEDTHGSSTQFDTFLVAHIVNQNIHYNDIRLDSLNSMPHCLITNNPQDIEVFFTNRSDAVNSPNSNNMISGTFKMEVRDDNGVLFHDTICTWNGDICFDIPSSLSLGSFVPRHGYNYVTVYVNTRNEEVDGYHSNDTIRISPYSCDSLLRGDYTVGGTNPDFPNMQAVKEALDFCGLGGPVVFHLRPGTYTDFDFDMNYINQSAENTITFQGDDVNTVIVTNNHTDVGANTYGAVTLVHVKNYIFKNLTIQGNETATASRGVVVRGNGSTNILFDGCKITAYNTHSTDITSSAVSRTTAVPNSTTNNPTNPDTITIRNCTITGGNFGVHYIGSTSQKNFVTIDGCNITSCYRGVYTNFTNGPISNNHIKQVVSSNPQNFTGIYVNNPVGADINNNTVDSVVKLEYGIYLGNAANSADFYVRNNRVHVGNGTAALYVTNSSSTNNITGYVYNNEVILYPVTAANSYAVQINNSNSLRIINNSIIAKSDAPYSNTAALYISTTGNQATQLYNNLLLNQVVCSDNKDYPLYLNGTSKAHGSYNNFHSGSGVVAFKNNVPRNSVAELEAADTNLNHSISYLPPFANITQSLLPSSFTGLECWRDGAVMADIRGINRSEVTYMGAYADAIPPIDAALTALVSPALGECPQLEYDITVAITNKGSQTLNFANNQAVIHIHSSAMNLDQDVTVNTGSVTALNSINQLLLSNVSIPVNQAVDFQIIINTSGDNNHSNDTLFQMFTMEAIFPDYEEDFSNGAQQTWTFQQISGAGNWTFQEGEGVDPSIIPEYGTGRLFFNSKNFPTTPVSPVSRAILPVVTLTGSVNPILELWFAHDNAASNKADGVTVKISTDNGVTYSNLIPQQQQTALIKRYKNVPTDWYLYTFDLSDYISAGCVFIAFDAEGKGGNNINIDRIRVRNLYNNDVAVAKIYGFGENPTDYEMRDVVCATIRNDGLSDQNNVQVYLNVTGANEQWQDTLTISSLPSHLDAPLVPDNQLQPDRLNNIQITFPDHNYNVQEVKDVEVRVATDQSNNNNAQHWRMVTTQNAATIADTTTRIQLLGDYNTIIRPCVRYKTNEELAVTAVKYYYDQTYIADPENGFRAFVSDAEGNILAKSELVDFSTLQQGAWNTIPIQNFALTNTTGEFYVGLEMLSHGNYLVAQVETPFRDSTFYYLQGGSYIPQKKGRFMIGAVVDTPFVHDVALLELVNPVTNCDLGHEHLKVRITNNGTTDIVPPIQLHYTINGGAVVTEAFTDTLRSHETTLFTFASIYDFTNNLIDYDSNYNINIWCTKLAQDRLTFNDSLNVVVVSRGKSPLPIVPDTVIVNYHTSTTLSAQLPASIQQGVIGWYTSTGYESWNLLGYSPTYTTPLIYFDTTYYATASPGTVEDVIVGAGTGSGADPFTFDKGYSRGRTIYLEQEVGHGTISSFAIQVKTPVNVNASAGIPMKIYMKCTDDNVFTSTNVNWDDEINGATLVVDDWVYFDQAGWFYFNLLTPFNFNSGNLVIFTETNCADYCTGTGNQCNNCGQYVSGAASYPVFYKTNSPTGSTLSQKKSGNTLAQMEGTYSPVSTRPNVRFMVANLECGSEKVPIRLHVPDIPTYDVETQELIEPVTGCALYDEHIKVKLKNMLNTPIPANKVVVHAVFNGSEITQTVDEPFAPEDTMIVEFTTPFDFSAPTTDITFNYTIYTTMINEPIVYTGNDTISGNFVSWRTAYLPDSVVYTGTYTNPYDILQPDDRPTDINQYTFYANENDATPIYTSTTAHPYYTTPDLYDTAIYWMSGTTKNGAAASGNHGCVTKRIKVIVNVFHPQYDFSTDELIYPVSYQCLNSLSPNLRVSVTNQDTASASVIPAGTFNLNAQFTGSANVSGTSLINDPVASLVQDTITFDNGMNLGSATQNRIYQYVVYTTPVNASMPVYTLNDTISGSMYIPALPDAPQPLTYTVPYGGTQTVTPGTSALNYYYFYENASDNQAMAEGSGFTTEPIFAPTTYYYSGRIESDGFDAPVIVGTGSDHSDVMFNLGKGHSYAKMLYTKEHLGSEGRIDSIYFQVHTAETNGIPIPMKFWLKDTANVQAIGTSNTKNINWSAETANATLVFDGEIALDQQGWVGFAVTGGYDYNGEGLLLYAEHDCGDNSCLNTYGINPVPKFSNTSCTTPNNSKKVYQYSDNNPATGAKSFQLKNFRINTKFKMNYTCESPKAPITINTTVPQHDVGVVAITAPVPQSNTFTNSEAVTVTLQNFGAQDASNFPVSYQLANGTPETQNFSGSLASGATTTMTFTNQVDLTSVYLPTPFRAYTGLSSDTYHNNDTTTILLSAEDPCPSRPLSSVDGAHITNVSIGSLNNGTGAPYTNHPTAPDNGMYTDYTQTVAPVTLILGQEYTLSATHAFTGTTTKTVHKKAYIDYNRNGVFTDPGEEVFSFPSILAGDTNAVTTGFVNIPTNAEVGLTRMRVICSSVALNSSGNSANCPCGFYNGDGETEDYAVLLSTPMDVDLGIPVILHPDGEVCADTNAIIRVNIRNYGTETQLLSMGNPMTITATVTGAVPGIYTKTVDNGTLSPNSEMTVSIPNVNFSAPGQYNVEVQLEYNGDQYLTNNTRSIDASVSNVPVEQLPFVEPFNPQNTDLTNPQLAAGWEVTSDANNYEWKQKVGASQNNATGGGPAHDHTYAGTPQQNLGGYVSIPGQNNSQNQSIYNKWTSLTSGCINMHYRNGYPSELYFYKYFANLSGADFLMKVETGSGSYYQTIGQLSKVDGGQVGGDDMWNDTLFVLHTVDEVARLRFTVTNQYKKIDPSIDDINLIVGKPDMAVNRIIYPDTTGCLTMNSVISPVIELYNNGNSAVEAFDVKFRVGVGSDIVTVTEHINHHLEPGESLEYTSTNEFVVTKLTQMWEVWATVIIPDDKYEYNNNKRVVTCTDVSVPNYEGEGGVSLGQNEPNPAVTATRIPYSMPVTDKVSFEITTTDGKVVYTTTEEAEIGDNYLDISTANLANGVYYYTLRYKDIVLTKKMVVER